MKDWKEVKLGEFFKVKHGFAFKGKDITNEKTKSILVTPGNFHIGGGFKSDKFKYFNNVFPQEYILNDDDIIVTMTDLSIKTDTLGYTAKVPKSKDDIKYLHNQRIGLVELLNENADREYLYWKMRTREYQWYIVSSASGTSIMHTSPTRICDYEFLIPPLPEQKAIAEVLSSLDDKIDLLHRQNETLEEMAQTLFRQWFVEEAEDSWETFFLKDLVSLKQGKYIKAEEISDIKSQEYNFPLYGGNGIRGYLNSFKYNTPKVGITCRGNGSGLVQLLDPFSTVSNSCIVFDNDDKTISTYFLYYYSKILDFASVTSGSAQPQITITDIGTLQLTVPDQSYLDRFNNQVKLYHQKIFSNQKQIQTLEKLRDTLLPKLMSGEVRVEM